MGRWLSAIFRKMFGVFGRKAEGLEEDPDVIASTYDNSIKKSGQNYQQTKSAVAKLMGIEESKKADLNNTTSEIDRLGKVKAGAAAKAKARVALLQSQGLNSDQIKSDSEIIRHQTAFNQATGSLDKAVYRSKEQGDVLERLSVNLARMKANLEKMQRNQQNLQQEKQEAIADVISAKEMEKVNELVSGISTDTSDKDLQLAREARKNVSNRARLAAEIGGIDATASDAEYEQAAMAASSGGEFDALIGLDAGPVKPVLDPARLPES